MESNTKYLVLSFGRSGSVLLAEKLGRANQVLPRYVKEPPQLSQDLVQHSHITFDSSQTADFVRVFNLRRDPIQTLLSFILSSRYQIYHRFKDQRFDFESFYFDKWTLLDRFINSYKNYHQHSGNFLHHKDLVVFYEDMLTQIADLNVAYLPLYENKQQIIKNYQEVVDYATVHEKSLLASQQAFVEHKNLFDIYSVINQ